MFSLKMILLSSLGLIIACLICSTWGEATKIKTLAKNAKLFFKKVKKLDSGLKLPESIHEFGKIKYRTGIWFRSIRSNEKYLSSFITEFLKLNQYTEEVVNDYNKQISKILQTRELGNHHDRVQLCNFYIRQILPKFEIEGYGKNVPQIVNLKAHFKNKLAELYNKISKIKSNTP